MNSAFELMRLLRPKHWVKSLFVFAGLFFGHALGDAVLVWHVVAAAVGFSLVSSAVYIVNDIADRDADRRHPVKCERPLAKGSVSVSAAVVLALLVGVVGGVAGYVASPLVAILLGLYGVLNIAYSFGLKRVVLLDVFIIAAGFMLRLLAGTSGVGIQPSQWLLLCGLMLTLFLGFVKRRAELGAESDSDKNLQRKVLRYYSPALLDSLITITAACIIMSYSLYTLSPETIALHHTVWLMLTVPFVIFGVFRYLFLLHYHQQGEDAATEAVRDPQLFITVVLWLGTTQWLLAR
jgi:4-hydroxybenzoate polyprenyltransferase